jgi:glycosyltransferase involved in cell wall biosynthesis
MNKNERNRNPLVSIIMPVHNCEEYITESINSIINQTYENFELIIVSTGSEDRTSDLIDKFSDKRIKVIELSSDKGLTHAFFQGFRASSGEFITRHDPDDISSPNRIKEQVEYLTTNEDLGMVSCLIKCITDTEKYRRACLFIEKLQNAYIDYEDIKKAVLGGFIPIVFPTLLIQRNVIDKINIPEEPEDFDDQIGMLLDLLKEAKVNKINKVLYTYRRHNKAYHILNEKEYYKYSKDSIDKSGLREYLIYSDFYAQKPPMRKIDINTNSTIRVLMLVDALNIGGTETHVLSLAKKLMEMGIYVVVGTSGGPLTNLFEHNGIKVYKVPLYTDYISNKSRYSIIKAVGDIIDKEKINMLHCHLFASMSIGSEFKRRYNIPYITTIHGMFYPNDILYSTCFNTDSIIAVSEPVKSLIRRRMGEEVKDKLFVIPNGVDTEVHDNNVEISHIRQGLRISKNDLVLTYCSRLAWNKTLAAEVFIFAFFKLAGNNNIHAIVIGDGDGKGIIQREADMLNKCLGRTAIHVVGAKHNVYDYYLSSDIVIGSGRVALEAMSCKKPVIAAGNTGYAGIINEQSKDMQWKLYFGDHSSNKTLDLVSLYEDMKYLIENDKERIEIGNWGSSWCNDMFSIDKVTRDTLSIYSNVLNERKTR